MRIARYAALYVAVVSQTLNVGTASEIPDLVVRGAKSHKKPTFTAKRQGKDLQVINTHSGVVVWQIQSNAGSHGEDIKLFLGPDLKHAILVFEYGVRGQSLYAMNPTTASQSQAARLTKKCRKIVSDILGVPDGSLMDLSFKIARWTSPKDCIVIWDASTPGGDDYNAGVIRVHFEKNGDPVLQTGRHQLKIDLDAARSLAANHYELLIQAPQPK